MVPFHNYPAGRATGNHWGDALTLLVTSARSPFHFSLHASDPTDPEGGSRKDTGHTLDLRTDRLGQDRLHRVSGRDAHARPGRPRSSSTRIGDLRSWCAPWAASTARLRTASRPGFNPLKLPPTPLNVEFLKSWLRVLVRPATGLAFRAPAGGPRSGAARNAGPGALRTAALAPHRVSGCDGRRGALCAARPWCEARRGLLLGL